MTSSALWFRRPADRWVEALPVGNGRLGAMVFGGVSRERWQVNEDSMWSGGPEDADNPAAYPALAEIRRLLFLGQYAQAQRLTDETQIRKQSTRGDFGSYTTLGELVLEHAAEAVAAGAVSDYRRELDLKRAVTTTEYSQAGTTYSRASFVSAPDQVLVIRMACTGPQKLNFNLTLTRPEADTVVLDAQTLELSGQLEQRGRRDGMKYAARAHVSCEGGRCHATPQGLRVENADRVLILFAAGTDYRKADFTRTLERQLAEARELDYETLLARHVADHEPRFARVQLELGATPISRLPTDERLLRTARGEADPELVALYFQLGRYLLISSSRAGTLAANLQGIWAEGLVNPWNGDYHTNINVQMNYWLAETTHLPDCVEPLVELIENMRAPGKKTAQTHYGARGWVVHTVHNVWGFTAPGDKPLWGLFPMAGPWLCQHLWEHYAFGGDLEFLRRVWPCLREATEFCLDWAVRHPVTGKLLSGPANSPENTFITPAGERCSISMGPSMDQQILWDHFTNVLDAARALGIQDGFVSQVAEARQQLLLPQVGSDGRLLEWAEPFAETEPQHRHVSHLFGLHPGKQLSMRTTPAWCEAARRTLEVRGDEATGWSRAWKICFWARLHDGDRALKLIQQLLTPVALANTEFSADGAGVYPNLFCAHPPFQIDGNFGAAAGIAEMLLQSHDGSITLLPALPAKWPRGRVSGLRARGGFVVDIGWSEGRLSHAVVSSTRGAPCEVRYGSTSIELQTAAGELYDLTQQLCSTARAPSAV